MTREQQGIEIDAASFARYNGVDAVKLFAEQLRYAGILTEGDSGVYTAWLPVGAAVAGPVARAASFLIAARARSREVSEGIELTSRVKRALEAYTQWHLGDRSWGEEIADYLESSDPYANFEADLGGETIASVLDDDEE